MSCQLQRTICKLIPSDINESEFQEALKTLSEACNLDFHDTVLKHAYFYRYCACNTNCVKSSWEEFGWELVWDFFRHFSRKGEIHVCCIGGGPGSDLLGLFEWLKMKSIPIQIHGLVLDKYDWSKETLQLLRTVDLCNQFNLSNTKFRSFDFFNAPIYEETKIHVGSADLISIVKFVSAVSRDKMKTKVLIEQFRDLFHYVKKNALIQFVDNSNGGFQDIMKQAARSAGLIQICEVEKYEASTPSQQVELLSQFRLKFPTEKSCKISASLWTKS